MRQTLTALAGAAAIGLALAGGADAGVRPGPRAGPAAFDAAPSSPDSLGGGWRQQQDEARELRREKQLLPLAAILEKIRRLNPGPRSQQLDAGLEYKGDKRIYHVRWMTNDGRVVDYYIDAVTGQVLSGG